MSGQTPKTYRQSKLGRYLFKIILIVFAALVILFFLALFGFRKYIAYTDTGKLYLDIPWLSDYMDGPPEYDELADQLTASRAENQ